MNSDHIERESWDEGLASARRKILNCRESIANAKAAAASEPAAAESFHRYAARKRLEMVNAALDVCDLHDRWAPRTHRPGDDELREHELRLGLPEGTFRRGVRDPGPAETIQLRQGLEVAKEVAEAELRASDPPALDPDYVPAVIRICCATLVGALVGAPLGALAIHENIVEKMIEAAIVTGLGATAAEIAGPLSELARRPADVPDQPAETPVHSAIDSVINELLHPASTAGELLPDPDDLPNPEDVPALEDDPADEPKPEPEPPQSPDELLHEPEPPWFEESGALGGG